MHEEQRARTCGHVAGNKHILSFPHVAIICLDRFANKKYNTFQRDKNIPPMPMNTSEKSRGGSRKEMSNPLNLKKKGEEQLQQT